MMRGAIDLATLPRENPGWATFWGAVGLLSGAALLAGAYLDARVSKPFRRDTTS